MGIPIVISKMRRTIWPVLWRSAQFIIAMVVILALDILQDLKGWISVTNNTWEKIGHMLGHILAVTLVICAWLIIIVFTLKVIWFILFRILL